MELLSRLILKVGDLLVGEYKLQRGVKGEIMFLHPELESMQGALKEIATAPPDQLCEQDKIWAPSEVRELSYEPTTSRTASTPSWCAARAARRQGRRTACGHSSVGAWIC